jgi:hypothetical protein
VFRRIENVKAAGRFFARLLVLDPGQSSDHTNEHRVAGLQVALI